MKKVQSPNPLLNPRKREKINLFTKDDPLAVEQMRATSAKEEERKVMLRLDDRTHVLVSPQNATPEYMDKLRQRYKIKYDIPARGGKKK